MAPCHRRWDAAEGSKCNLLKKETYPLREHIKKVFPPSVMRHMQFVFLGQSCETSRGRVCYQQGYLVQLADLGKARGCSIRTFAINRPGVAGVDLHTASSLTHSVMVCGNIFKALSSPTHKSLGAEILRVFTPHHVSHVTCPMSGVTIFVLIFLQNYGACLGRVCYERGLPRLVH